MTRRRLEAEARTDAPQGVLAHAGPLVESELDDLCATRGGVAPLPGGLRRRDRSPQPRVRSCARPSAPESPVCVVPRHRSAHVTPTVTKVAAGAVEHLAMAVVPGVPNALLRLTEAGVISVGLDAGADPPCSRLAAGAVDVTGPLALVIGAEGKGLAPLTRKRCTLLVSIPQHGTIESLNVAAAGAVAFFEVARARATSAGDDRARRP